jgi:ABC-2 type transport system permease protein
MRTALIAEYRKFVTTRMWWVLLLTMVVYMGFTAALIAFSVTIDPSEGGLGAFDPSNPGQMTALPPRALALTVYTLASSFGYVFPVLMGTLSVAGEYRHMTITPTLLAEPRRNVVLGAKLISSLPIGLLYGLLGTASVVGGGAAVLALRGNDAMLTDGKVLQVIGWSVVALTVWAMVGVGFGTVLKNQVAAIVVVLAFTQLVEPTLRFAFGFISILKGVPKWLPGAAGDAIAGSSFYSTTGINDLLPRWQGLLVLIGYGVVLAAVGRFTTFRKDVT